MKTSASKDYSTMQLSVVVKNSQMLLDKNLLKYLSIFVCLP